MAKRSDGNGRNKRTYRSGHCNPSHSADLHAACRGRYAGYDCACDCHQEKPSLHVVKDDPKPCYRLNPDDPCEPDDCACVPQPGVWDVSAEEYHADPVHVGSLSSSGARKLLPPSCPARFKWERDHPPAPSKAFDLGHAAHKLVLGVGPELVVVDAPDWRTKDARTARDAAHAAGAVPLLTKEHDQVQAMAAAIRAHPVASVLLQSSGQPEKTLIWRDHQSGIWCRARLDHLPDPDDGRMIVPDYKTTQSAALEAIAKSVATYGYHQQAAWYLSGIRTLGLAGDAVFVFVFQEKDPPYLVTVVQPDQMSLRIGGALNRRAIDTYVQCVKTDTWPAYADDVELVHLPTYIETRYIQEFAL